jgi:hypothetical protein
MKERALLLFILFLCLLPANGSGQDPPFARFLTINSSHLAEQAVYIYKAWVTYSSGEQDLITGDVTFLH